MAERMGPIPEGHFVVVDELVCPGCKLGFEVGCYVALVAVGPGDDPEERVRASEDRPYNAIAIPAHYVCVTGKEK